MSDFISSWSPFTLGSIPETALPVTLISFAARAVETGVGTTSEENASHFEVDGAWMPGASTK